MADRPVPYWQRMPQFFLYPLRPPGVFFVLALGAAGALANTLGLVAMVISAFVLPLIALRYAYEALASTAEGEFTPPPLDGETLIHGYELPFKQYAFLLVLGMIAGVPASLLPPILIMPWFVAVLALAPAGIMILAWSRSLRQSLNPAMIAHVIGALRWHYLALLGLVTLTNVALGNVLVLTGATASSGYFIVVVAQTYFTVMGFHLMGYFVYQFGDRLGLAPAWEDQGDVVDGEDLSAAERFLAEHNYPAALAELRDCVGRQPHSTELVKRLHRAAQLAGDERAVREAADTLIARHADAGRYAEATVAWLESRQHDPQYRPSDPAVYPVLAETLRLRGQAREALHLVNGFHKRFPGRSEIPRLYALAARLFREELGDETKASALETFLTSNYPDHPDVASLAAWPKRRTARA